MKLSFRLKLLAWTLGVILLVGGSISLYSVYLGREKIFKGFLKEALHITTLLSSNLADDLYDLDVLSLRLKLENTHMNPDLRKGYVMDVQGVVLADGTAENALRDRTLTDPFSRQVLNADDWIFLKDEEMLRVGGPISMADGTLVGYLYLVFSLDGVTQIARDSTQASLLITIVFLCIGAFLAFFLSMRFTRPILEIAGAANAIGGGKFDTRVQIKSQDELGLLGSSINQLAVDLREKTISKDYFNQIIASMAEMLIVVDSKLNIQTVNTATCQTLGYDANALVERPLSLILPEVPIHAIRGLVEKESAWSGETSYLTKEGCTIPVVFSASVMQSDGDRLWDLVCVAQDITERKRVEKALELTQFSIDHASDPAFFMESDARFFYVNDAACRALGYSRDELLTMTVHDIDPDFPREVWPGHWEDLKKRQSLQLESHHRTKDGRVFPVEITANYIAFQEKEYSCTFTRDVTERKRLEEKLRHSQKLEGIGHLAGGVAHEFNNLLTPIIGHLESALEQSADRPEVKEALLPVDKAAKRAAALTKELLAFSRQNTLDLQSQDLSAIAEEVVHLLRQTIDRRIEIATEPADNLWPVLIDMDQMHQVTMNLCVNARDALEERLAESTDFQALIQITLKNMHLDKAFCKTHLGAKVGDYVCLSVSDNGSGMDEAVQQHIFEPFFTTKEIGRGTGLGLPSSYGIVKKHKGWIGLISRKGEGTTFEVYLPRTEHPIVPKPRTLADKPEAHGTETILFVDDDELIREMAKTALEMRGYSVLSAEDGEQALEIFRQARTRIRLAVLDLSMPRQSGWEVLRRLRLLDPELKVIIATGHDLSGHVKGRNNLEPDATLQKPYTPRELTRKVRATLDQDAHSS
ncbi:MAG: PAS domain S-box protein [Nitrospiria bacterium]